MQIGTDYFASVTLPLSQSEESSDCKEAIWSSGRVKPAVVQVLKRAADQAGAGVSEGGVVAEMSKGGSQEGQHNQ